MSQSPTPEPASGSARSQDTRPRSAMALWLQHHYVQIMAVFGGLLLVMAVIAPVVSPEDQRGQVVIMTILFGLIGALMLYMAAAPSSRVATNQRAKDPNVPTLRINPHAVGHDAARIALQARAAQRSKIRALAGLTFGLLFATAGAVSPFILGEGEGNADARFLMMMGFAPVVISGVFMIALFGRTLAGRTERDTKPYAKTPEPQPVAVQGESLVSAFSTVGTVTGLLLVLCACILPFAVNDAARPGMLTTSIVMAILGIGLSLLGVFIRRRERAVAQPATRQTVRRSPVPRVPVNTLYRLVVPAVIGLAVLIIVAVIAVVILATVTPLVR